MKEQGTYIRLDEIPVEDARPGSFRKTIADSAGCQITYIIHDEGAGHDFHRHDDADEILVFLEGHCILGLGDAELEVRGGSLAHVPRGVPHKVKYLAKSKVIRIKFPNP